MQIILVLVVLILILLALAFDFVVVPWALMTLLGIVGITVSFAQALAIVLIIQVIAFIFRK